MSICTQIYLGFLLFENQKFNKPVVSLNENFTFLPLLVVSRRPTTDIVHVLACMHCPCLVTCSTGVGEGQNQSPRRGQNVLGIQCPNILVVLHICQNCLTKFVYILPTSHISSSKIRKSLTVIEMVHCIIEDI